MIRSVDHIVILVDELDQSIQDYTALGFTVKPGGDHPNGVTHNALIIFEDGIYFELIAFKQPDEAHAWWHKGKRNGEGFVDYAMLPSAIEQDIADARERGLEIAGPFPGGRLRPDGVQVAWQTARASEDLPFLCGDITPRELRVPTGEVRQHANGVLGVAEITIAVTDVEVSFERYRALLGDATPFVQNPASNTSPGIRSAALVVGNTLVTLAAPDGANGDHQLRDYLVDRGEGPYAVALHVAHESDARMLDQERTHGASLQLVPAERGPHEQELP